MKFRLGINYWPASSAMDWWQRFNAAEVEEDFSRIAAAGFDSVRVFLRWEDFQPRPDRVSEEALGRLLAVADAAGRRGLALMPTLFTGHMSGVNWIPSWALDPGGISPRFRVVSGGRVVNAGIKNWYADEMLLQAQILLAREVAASLASHPALWAWDLGNESSNCVVPPSRQAGQVWLERVVSAMKAVDPSHPITMGLHLEDLEEDRRLGPGEVAQVCDFLCMHGYPSYAAWARSPTDELILPFLGLITRWLGGRDVLFEEFGAPTVAGGDLKAAAALGGSRIPLLDEEVGARFTGRALTALQRFGLLGAMLWCYGDYAEALWSEPPLDVAWHERYFGLWRADGAAKPAAGEVRRAAGSEKRATWDDFSWIDIDRETFYANPRETLRRLYQRFCERIAAPLADSAWPCMGG